MGQFELLVGRLLHHQKLMRENAYTKTYKQFVNEGAGRVQYDEWEKGLIKAWGDLLYLSFHHLPEKLPNLVDMSKFKAEFERYYREADTDEDFQEWMSESPPTYNKGSEALFDRVRLDTALASIARKYPTEGDLVVYRSSENEEPRGWSSYSLSPDSYEHGENRKYTLKKGTPVIWADGLADKDEVIINMKH